MSGRVANHLSMSVHLHNARGAGRSANFHFDDEPRLPAPAAPSFAPNPRFVKMEFDKR
jgi:hypothetical protein